MWTTDNTEGFTQGQLNLINTAFDKLIADGMDEKAASDLINNAWTDDIETAAKYFEENNCVRRDDIESLPEGFKGFWISCAMPAVSSPREAIFSE